MDPTVIAVAPAAFGLAWSLAAGVLSVVRKKNARLVSANPPYDWVWTEFGEPPSPLAPEDLAAAVSALKNASWLALIEQNAGLGDQQAAYFTELVESLRRVGAPIAGYRCDSDPRACFEPTGEPVTLDALHERHPGARLLYFGNGTALAHLSGLLAGRITAAGEVLLRLWPDGALLGPFITGTDAPGVRGGAMRIASGERWAVLPPTLAAIAAFAAVGPGVAVGPLASALDDEDRLPPSPDLIEAPLHVAQIAAHFGENALPANALALWLASLALPDEVRWKLTLALGGEIATQTGANLVTEENVLRLLRVSYVAEGYLSASVRLALTGWLAAQNPALESRLRSRIVDTMRRPSNVPPSGSAAIQKHALEEAIHLWLQAPTRSALTPELTAARETIRQAPTYLARGHGILPYLATTRPLGSRAIFHRGIPRADFLRTETIATTFAALTLVGLFSLPTPTPTIKPTPTPAPTATPTLPKDGEGQPASDVSTKLDMPEGADLVTTPDVTPTPTAKPTPTPTDAPTAVPDRRAKRRLDQAKRDLEKVRSEINDKQKQAENLGNEIDEITKTIKDQYAEVLKIKLGKDVSETLMNLEREISRLKDKRKEDQEKLNIDEKDIKDLRAKGTKLEETIKQLESSGIK